ncbi:MAG: AAA family ATPase [Prevotellaceae bacterium]|nr:AAA family ATPase [Prevotellaceae bacterium]
MVTIDKIEIKGFFGKGDLEWNLDPVVNILGGKNGSGKSTLFKLCYALLSSDEIDEKRDKLFSTLFQKAVITLSNGWSVIWRCETEKDEYILRMDASNKLYRTDAIVVLDENGMERKFSELKEQTKVFMINSFEQYAAKASGYSQLTTQTMTDPTMLDLMIKDQIDLRNKDFSKTMEDFVDSPDENEEERSVYVQTYKKIYESLGHFLQGYDKPFKSTFDFSKDGQRVGIEGLSMGEKQITLLLLMVSNTNQAPCIFFMDEPDLSMHIDWKEILIKELHALNDNMQIIISTHAPSVITGWHDKVREVDQLIKK